MNRSELPDFIDAYIACALWSSTDDADDMGGEPLDANYDAGDLAPPTLAKMEADCAAFVEANAASLEEWDASQAGHDFWLTRNWHGAGYWDRYRRQWNQDAGEYVGEPMPCRDELTGAARICSEVYLYIGDDGLIYC